MSHQRKPKFGLTKLFLSSLFVTAIVGISATGIANANIFLDDPNGTSGRYKPQSLPKPPTPDEDLMFDSTVEPPENTKKPLIIVKAGSGEGIVTSSRPGIDCGSVCAAYFESEISLELKAVPHEGSIFKGWEGSEDCTDGVVSMRERQTCTAIFESAFQQDKSWQHTPNQKDIYWVEGNVGVGTNIPQKNLEVAGSIKGDTVCIKDDCRNEWPEFTPAEEEEEELWKQSNAGDVYTDSFVGIGMDAPIYPLQVKGHAWVMRFMVAEKFFRFSDIRLKKNIEPLIGSLEKILSLSGVNFEWKDAAKESGAQIGLIAQDVEQVFPEFVTTGPDGMKTVDYSGLVVPLIEAVKEQEKRIQKLESTIAELQK